jgi:hypothetical protein
MQPTPVTSGCGLPDRRRRPATVFQP